MMNNKPASAALPDKGPESDGERIERIRKRIQGFVSLSTITLEVMLTNGISISGVYKTFSISNPNLGYATTEAFFDSYIVRW